MINSQDVSVIFQGHLNVHALGSGAQDGSDFLYNVARTREQLPHAQLILSSWDHVELPAQYNTPEKLGIDALILNPDPDGLPNIKFGYDAPNNVNRQIISTQAGLNLVTTPYVLKLRIDSFLNHAHFLEHYQHYTAQIQAQLPAAHTLQTYTPIVVPHFFTIDPNVFENMAFHISDWSQFGETATLKAYWSAQLMSKADATHFERHAHEVDNAFADNAFRTRLAVEQHIATQYARALGYSVPTQYNHITPEILRAHRDFLASQIIVLDMADFGLNLPKYAWASYDEFMSINCINHADWYQLFCAYWQSYQVSIDPDQQQIAAAQYRKQLKSRASHTFKRFSESEHAHLLGQLYPSSVR